MLTMFRLLVYLSVLVINCLQWHETWRALIALFKKNTPPVNVTRAVLATQMRGRLGLCLSGGGLRAAFLHLGLLARMAECDMLRDLEALSCTSGGSTLGSCLYLQLKQLLETKVAYNWNSC